MENIKQKDIFLNGEGDSWYERNKENQKNLEILNKFKFEILSLPIPNKKDIKVLEIGCGQGRFLNLLKQNREWQFYGIDPSKKAIDFAKNIGINAFIGTADEIPFSDDTFDLIIFGFCLYLVDKKDLFKIAFEAHRTSKEKSWISILDFWSKGYTKNKYKHSSGIYSNKYDLPKMFTWHPSYVIVDHKLRHHDDFSHTDKNEHWIAITNLRKIDTN